MNGIEEFQDTLTIVKMLKEGAEALKYLHSQEIIHRNLNPS
jgi:serine/threonine protein kinase